MPFSNFVLNRSDRGNALTYRMAIEMTERIVDAARGDITHVSSSAGRQGIPFGHGPGREQRLNRAKAKDGEFGTPYVVGPASVDGGDLAVQLPVVTVVRGYAAGIGFALALSGDYIVADETATFWAPDVAVVSHPTAASHGSYPSSSEWRARRTPFSERGRSTWRRLMSGE